MTLLLDLQLKKRKAVYDSFIRLTVCDKFVSIAPDNFGAI